MKFLWSICAFLLLSNLWASANPSAIRELNTDYRNYMHKDFKGAYSATNPENVAKLYSDFDQPALTQWESSQQVMEAFTTIRDLRFIPWQYEYGKDFPRRSTWLYPDDGCYVRAELAVKNLEERGYTNLYKVFAFGNLKVDTENHPSGYVGWWYHVVPIILLDNDYLVFDPAIEPAGPLTLEQWLSTMSDNIDELEVAICQAHTVYPFESCYNPEEPSYSSMKIAQLRFFGQEWRRLIMLDRDPYRELGDNPPWK